MERMCEKVIDSEYHQIQHFISESPWDWREVFDSVSAGLNEAMLTVEGRTGLLSNLAVILY